MIFNSGGFGLVQHQKLAGGWTLTSVHDMYSVFVGVGLSSGWPLSCAGCQADAARQPVARPTGNVGCDPDHRYKAKPLPPKGAPCVVESYAVCRAPFGAPYLVHTEPQLELHVEMQMERHMGFHNYLPVGTCDYPAIRKG